MLILSSYALALCSPVLSDVTSSYSIACGQLGEGVGGAMSLTGAEMGPRGSWTGRASSRDPCGGTNRDLGPPRGSSSKLAADALQPKHEAEAEGAFLLLAIELGRDCTGSMIRESRRR